MTDAKRLARLCGGLAAAACLTVLACDISWYARYHHRTEALIEAAATEDRSLPASVSGLLHTSLQGRTCSYAARLLIGELLHESAAWESTLGWQATFTFWSMLTCLHLSDQDRTALIASLAPTGRSAKGLTATAQTLYGRALSQLDLSEAASVVELTKQPYLRTQPARLAESSRTLLAQYAAGS